MSREIKFRAWDEGNKKMLLVKKLHFGEEVQVEHTESRWDWYQRNVPIMQYTGLKDCNGVEIFEGDVVTGINRINECDIKQNVHFLNGCFMFGNWNAHEFFNRHQEIKVIGNIYEKRELQEVQ